MDEWWRDAVFTRCIRVPSPTATVMASAVALAVWPPFGFSTSPEVDDSLQRLIASAPSVGGRLAPDSAAWLV